MKKFIAFAVLFSFLLGFVPAVIVSAQTEATAIEIIVDNLDPGFSTDSPWVLSKIHNNCYGPDYYDDGTDGSDPNKWAKWEFKIEKSGIYEVYMWTPGGGGNQVSKVPLEISHKYGTDVAQDINQRRDNGRWMLVEEYEYDAGKTYYVKAKASGGGHTVADAVKITFLRENIPQSKDSNMLAVRRFLSTKIALFVGSSNAKVFGADKVIDSVKSVTPKVVDGRTFVPIRFVAESLGANVTYNDATKKLTMLCENQKVMLTIDQNEIFIDGRSFSIDVAPFIENARTYVPIRFIAQALGKEILWDDRGLILISPKDKPADAFLDKYLIDDVIKELTYEPVYPSDIIFLEAENFNSRGGWGLDQQSMDSMGSPYLLAHGLGNPVLDAKTDFFSYSSGEYQLWVRTRDWVASFDSPGAPGKFKVAVNEKEDSTVFGVNGAEWSWQKGGKVTLKSGKNSIALKDMTGFEGRCDAIILTKDSGYFPPDSGIELRKLRERARAGTKFTDAGHYDLVVVGGGVGGLCAAVTAARLGIKVALIQDRPVLGGNNSNEINVGLSGEIMQEPYPRVGSLVSEIKHNNVMPDTPADKTLEWRDLQKADIALREPNLDLYLNNHVNLVENYPNGTIKAVYADSIINGDVLKVSGTLFADCTGDGLVGYLCSADYDVQKKRHLGSSTLWGVTNVGKPTEFSINFGFDLTDIRFPGRYLESEAETAKLLYGWYWEAGYDNDQILESELIRDTNFMAMYSAFHTLKNVDKRMSHYILSPSNKYMMGRRESLRLMGDIILSQDDVFDKVIYEDGCFPTTWSMDLHYKDFNYDQDKVKFPFIAYCKQPDINGPYWVPYRCLYSRNIDNLFMAGRDISVTHEALGTVRVMATIGMMGEIVGMAAKICIDKDVMPRAVYMTYLKELKEYMSVGVGANW